MNSHVPVLYQGILKISINGVAVKSGRCSCTPSQQYDHDHVSKKPATALIVLRSCAALHSCTFRVDPDPWRLYSAVEHNSTRVLILDDIGVDSVPPRTPRWYPTVQAIVVTAMGCGPLTRLVRCAGFRGAFLTGVVVQATCLLCASFLRPNAAG